MRILTWKFKLVFWQVFIQSNFGDKNRTFASVCYCYTLNCHLVTMITNDHGAAEIKNLHHFVKEEISCCWEIPMKNKSRGSLCILSDSLFPKKTNYVTKIHHIIIKSVALCCVARASNFDWKWIFIKRNISCWNNATFCNKFWANQSNLSVFFQVKRFKTTIK